jgi:hypothetical protein
MEGNYSICTGGLKNFYNKDDIKTDANLLINSLYLLLFSRGSIQTNKCNMGACSAVTNWEAAFVVAILLVHPAYWETENDERKR